MEDYDRALEAFSKPLLNFIKYNLNDAGQLEILNNNLVAPYFKFHNLTTQCVYVLSTILNAIKNIEIKITYLNNYDNLIIAIEHYIDLPNKYLNKLIVFLHQNKGTLSKNKRKLFDLLTDKEISQIEELYFKVFN